MKLLTGLLLLTISTNVFAASEDTCKSRLSAVVVAFKSANKDFSIARNERSNRKKLNSYSTILEMLEKSETFGEVYLDCKEFIKYTQEQITKYDGMLLRTNNVVGCELGRIQYDSLKAGYSEYTLKRDREHREILLMAAKRDSIDEEGKAQILSDMVPNIDDNIQRTKKKLDILDNVLNKKYCDAFNPALNTFITELRVIVNDELSKYEQLLEDVQAIVK